MPHELLGRQLVARRFRSREAAGIVGQHGRHVVIEHGDWHETKTYFIPFACRLYRK